MSKQNPEQVFGFKFKVKHLKDVSERSKALVNIRWVMENFLDNVIKNCGTQNILTEEARAMVENECLRLRKHLTHNEWNNIVKVFTSRLGKDMTTESTVGFKRGC